MPEPFFTVAIPTKNRPDRVTDAVRSVVEQSFGDLEVIVCDNSDAAEAAQTAVVVERFGDDRIRYVRTSGRLSMPDNWERAVSGARGEFVGVLTDRSVFRRDALEVIRGEIASTDARLVTFLNDIYGRGPDGRGLRRRVCTHARYQHSSAALLEYFVHGDPQFATKVVPKLMTSFCHRSILAEIRSGPVGRCCPPVAPDFTSGFLMLAHCDWALSIDEALYVSVGSGNGAEFRHGGELADRFIRDLGMQRRELVDRMPSSACFAHALVLNDLMRVGELVPDRLGHLEIDRAQYYLGCLNDYTKATRNGADREADLALLLEALRREEASVVDRVKATTVFARAIAQRGVRERVKARIVAVAGNPRTPALPSFDTVFEAMAWDEAHPRSPSARSFLDLTGTVDAMPKSRSGAVTRLRGALRRDRVATGLR